MAVTIYILPQGEFPAIIQQMKKDKAYTLQLTQLILHFAFLVREDCYFTEQQLEMMYDEMGVQELFRQNALVALVETALTPRISPEFGRCYRLTPKDRDQYQAKLKGPETLQALQAKVPQGPETAVKQEGPNMHERIARRIAAIVKRCEQAYAPFGKEPLSSMQARLAPAIDQLEMVASGSWSGYHATVYQKEFRPLEHADFSPLRGLDALAMVAGWAQYGYQDVVQEILKRSGVESLDPLKKAVDDASEVFGRDKVELLSTLDALIQEGMNEPTINQLWQRVNVLEGKLSGTYIGMPPIQMDPHIQIEERARNQGVRAPLHIEFRRWLYESFSTGRQVKELGGLAQHLVAYLRTKKEIAVPAAPPARHPAKLGTKVFIGHGHSGVWKDLVLYLQNRLHLPTDEFNTESAAGLPTQERLGNMLDGAVFAFLVMTGEDASVTGKLRPRENVVHEAGLFQGRLGFKRAIVLLEEGCDEFSNIVGLGQIRFPKGDIKPAQDQIRQVLEREGVIKPTGV